MKPQPMSDAEIAGIVERFAGDDYPRWSELERINAEILVKLTLVARDAQWAAMIGEPVAWRLSGAFHEGPDGPKYWVRSPTPEELAMWASFGKPATVSPLYAIKETP